MLPQQPDPQLPHAVRFVAHSINRIVFPMSWATRTIYGRRSVAAWVGAVVCALGVVAVDGLLAGQPAPALAETGVDAASPDQIARWIQELDHSRFVTRRNATERLIAAGRGAIEPVVKALTGSNLEVATRGIHVLRTLALSNDIATEDAATKALHELATAPSKSVARQAAAALAELGEIRQQLAIKELEDLGARISVNDRMLAFAPVVGLSVEIGPDWQGAVDDLQRFRWLTDVQEVSFVGNQITDDCVRHVEYLEGVERVLIKRAEISNEAVKSIAKLKRVTQVDLMYTPINDAALEYLKDMKTVREVHLYGTNVTPEAAKQYELAVANVRVYYKMGAFLGVSCREAPLPCQVTTVIADSAAANAGIEVLDIVVRYGGQPVANFDELRKLIGKNKVGDSVLIQVVRSGRPVHGIVEERGNLELGLEVEALSYGCRVQKLVQNGAAAKAGLQVGDVIMEINGESVTNMDGLSKVYATLEADALVEFRGLRNPRLMSRRVTFGEWTESSQ
jgi:hypothetical protein